jgi:amino acid adenylation domain-containing protein
MCLERSLAVPVAVLGILKAGGAYLPLDPAYPAERLAAMMDDARLRWLVCDESTLGLLPASLRERSRVLLLGPAGEMDSGVEGELATTPVLVAPENLAYVLYTSGSTGRPKGVAMPHGPLANLIDWQIQVTTAPGPLRTAQFSALSFDASFHEMFTTWSQGGALVLLSEAVRRDLGSLLHLLAGSSIQQLFLPFVALQQLAEEAIASAIFPTALREVITAGEQLQATAAVRELFRRLPGCRLVNAYGPTETHVVTAFTLAESPDDWPNLPPIGSPIANLWARVLDASFQPVLPGVPGEIYFGGAGLARGYLGRPDLTAERFLPDPQATEPGARVYRTGDLVRYLSDSGRTDGAIAFLGRNDHQVKVRGFRVEPGDIETALSLHPGVREAAVVVREVSDPGDRRLVGYFVPRGRSTAEAGDALAAELRTFLASRLPDYMVPWALVPLEAFPLTPSGKLDRRNLPAPAVARRLEAGLAPPRGPVEELLARIWAEVLGLERVGSAGHFFELGGHSLLATRVMSRLRGIFDIQMPLRVLFEAPRLADLAARVEEALRAGAGQVAPPLAPVSRDEPLPLSFAQERLWLLYVLEPESPAFHLGGAVRLTGPLAPGAFSAGLSETVRRHEVLRTRYQESGDGPVQIVDPAAPFPLPLVDLGGLREGAREGELRRLAKRERERPFDLTRDWPLRTHLVRLSREEHAALFTLHHIAGDGWSLGLLTREVGALYAAFAAGSAGGPATLPEPPVQYADYAVWQRGWLNGERLEPQLAWWQDQLAGPLPVLELPQRRHRQGTPGFRGAACPVVVPAGLRRSLEKIGHGEGATLFMTLLAGFKALLHLYSGQQDLLVGTNIANRDRSEIEGLIGVFINNLVLRTDLSGNPAFRQLVRRVRDVTLGAFAYQEVPFEKVLEAVQPQRQTAFAPLFQVMFVLQSFPVAAPRAGGLEIAPLELEERTANFDLTLVLSEEAGRLRGALHYDTDLFAEAAMERMAEQFLALLACVADEPDLPLSAIPMTAESDLRQLASAFNEDF